MKLIFKNKKGVDIFTAIFTIFAITALMFVLVTVTLQYNTLTTTIGQDGVGTRASEILVVYEKTDSALLYLDNAAGIAATQSAYDVALLGFKDKQECYNEGSASLWSMGFAEPTGDNRCEATLSNYCTPGSSSATFSGLLTKNLDNLLGNYPASDVIFPQSNYGYTITEFGDETEIVGKAKSPVKIESRNLKYEVLPSFRERVGVNVRGDWRYIKGKIDNVFAENDELSRQAIDSAVSGFNSEDTEYSWSVSYSDDCSIRCDLHSECEIRFEKTEEQCDKISETKCDIEEESGEETNCRDVEKEECEDVITAYYEPGKKNHEYCSKTALIEVALDDETQDDNIKKVMTAEGLQPLNYKFGLNWVEMESVRCCNSDGCYGDFRD